MWMIVNEIVRAAGTYLTTHGRLLDRRRLDLFLGTCSPDQVLAALDAYQNPDSGYGWGLEPDLRARRSQPVGAMHALEVLVEISAAGADTSRRAWRLCDWLDEHTLADGGLPFALPIEDTAGCASFWADADPTRSSLQMTAQVAAEAYLLGGFEPTLTSHAWLRKATQYCLMAIGAREGPMPAHEVLFAVRFLDAVATHRPEAMSLLDRLGRELRVDGSIPVDGGAAGEVVYPLDLSPRPEGPSRRLFGDRVIAADLDRLIREQRGDGGWPVTFKAFSPAAALEWRGYATVAAIRVLRDHGLL
jgi:hypothetical protein